MHDKESYIIMGYNQMDLNDSFDQMSLNNSFSFGEFNNDRLNPFDNNFSHFNLSQQLDEKIPLSFTLDQINKSEDIPDEPYKLEKSPNNSEENLSRKKTLASNASRKNSSENNFQLEIQIPKSLEKIPNFEKSQNFDELNHKNNRKKSLEIYEFNSLKKILEKNGAKLEKVIDILTDNGINTKNIEKKLENTEKVEKKKLTGNKRKNDEIEENKQKKENTKGRKKEGDNSGEHTKMKDDNLMFKIKSNLNKWLLNLVNEYLPDSQKLLKIDFKDFSKVINRNENLKFLKMDLREIFSKNISKVYSKKILEEDGAKINKNIIEEIMKSNNEKAKAVLKLKYKDGLDLFRFQENENIKKILGDEIINDIKGRVDEFLLKTFNEEMKKIGEENASDFVSSLLVMVYNYERWFLLKFPRKKRENTNKIE